jgi:hypothetical protein
MIAFALARGLIRISGMYSYLHISLEYPRIDIIGWGGRSKG